ncbi:MFS general substrate transporter [Laetiporus sulphureus 93-53]|uniref:MFS general substrate transporter n=1 Tax=Laetiporus sulphureus 93-53 TaxID=1314785 RepID=A0A165CAK2_9APHY|nr:MFS general substrate transporter [Laetiporus sulphureus 93-53]KZT02466.1 MFS general substrate transporter [Laetiporus sulphureus 93-53]
MTRPGVEHDAQKHRVGSSTDGSNTAERVEAGHHAPDHDHVKAYSIYTSSEKWFIVAVAAFASLFSPFTANIYFPAIPTIAAAFHKSTEDINLTVTVYLIVQGLSPIFWGTLADRWGRRPMFLGCLLVLFLSCIGLALIPTDAYWALMVLRCVQAAGSASTVALGAGVIADIAAPYERGTYFGFWNVGPMVGPCVGPVLGGVLAENLGWRSIFWFLVIASAVCFVVILLFLPETLRAFVGDGSIPPPRFYYPLIPIVGRNRQKVTPQDPSTRPARRRFNNPLILFLYPDILLLLFFNGMIYSVFYAVTISISTLFKSSYTFLNETDIGLCFLAIGGGMLIGGVITGRVLDYEYRRVKNQMFAKFAIETDPEKKVRPEDVTKDENFPIEKARLRLMPFYFGLFVVATIVYGWTLDAGTNIAGPLISSIFVGYAVVANMNVTQTLIVDLVPGQSAAVTACNNMVRCSLGAVMVSVINPILNAMGPGWTYVLLPGICVVLSPIMIFTYHIGPRWRARRRARRQAREAATAS